MKRTSIIATLLCMTVACQKDLSTSESTLDTQKISTLKQTVSSDPLLIEQCEVSFQSQELVASQVKQYNLKAADLQKIDFKKISTDQELVSALKGIGFHGAEEYVRLRKKQESLLKQLHQKYPGLLKMPLEDWNEIVGEGFKKVYASKGMNYYGIPDKAN